MVKESFFAKCSYPIFSVSEWKRFCFNGCFNDTRVCFVILPGLGGGAEAVIMAEITRSTEESKRTGIISKLIAVRQMGLLVGNILLSTYIYIYLFRCNSQQVIQVFKADCIF